MTRHLEIGRIGEDIACRYFENKGFVVIGRNYRKSWGEIDIIVSKARVLHFVEVKSVSCENVDTVSRETSFHRPEDNAHPAKLKRLARTVETYLAEKGLTEGDWTFDVVTVHVDQNSKRAKVSMIDNVIL